jgi:hypothetical protein
MSLTSYRAAPPRVCWLLRDLLYRIPVFILFVRLRGRGLLHPAGVGSQGSEDRSQRTGRLRLTSDFRLLITDFWKGNAIGLRVGFRPEDLAATYSPTS